MQTDTLRLALVQMNPTVGALTANAARIEAAARQAAAAGAQVILFPELALCGYPPEDLVLKRHFLRACAGACAELLPRLPPEPVILLGLPEVGPGGRAVNALAVLHGGRQAGSYHK
ncbi:MAG: NAD+ synthase, partial [Candidatus Marinimicrobia bacterium]|nr:NAD+ synthase [Candidatus Neomarinimicrobiota bacterium]